MSTKTALDSPLEDVATEIEERRCGLIGRHQELRNKVVTMERSIPALMAYNMWMTERDCRGRPYDKVREIVNKFLPQPDSADRLLAQLKNTVEGLHQETTQLHDKIIDADVKLEETSMELESLELANQEMEEKLAGLRKEVQKYNTPSLHSIHSEDLICLKRIHQLAEEELKLKNYIRELESKELMYRRQMNKLLSCKEFQRDGVKITERAQELRETCCPCTTSTTLNDYKKTSKNPFKPCEKLYPPRSCCIPLDCESRAATSKSCKCNKLSDVKRSPKEFVQTSMPCEPRKTCNECTIPACKQINIREYNYEKKFKNELLVTQRSCSIKSLNKVQSASLEKLHSDSKIDDSSDEEFCECCTCGCETDDS
ncbi:hypothetical protein PUN28_000479 [Cardiocondyla obscurior]|uniref:Uncharacterized protein n=1 Tax=Cardiocondyla obscurior TaxID=286306 RepID=A0AAW2H029_9HYME